MLLNTTIPLVGVLINLSIRLNAIYVMFFSIKKKKSVKVENRATLTK